jgi:LysR family transcriptional regulator, glycine cleavage system transcriptional activator
MTNQLPPLNSLRAFVHAARHLSFTKAAEDLHVTPAAVSHQVKLLEEFIGAPLFHRLTRALRLTDRGKVALPVLAGGFDKLAEGAALLLEGQDQDVLTLSSTPSFTAQWLVPRLADFQDHNPDIKVRIDANIEVIDLRKEGIDAAIRWGSGDYPGHEVHRLFDEEIFPVCSPALLRGEHPLRQPGDLVHHTLLHASSVVGQLSYADWRMWLKLADAPDVNWRKGPEFSVENLAVQAAVEGHGVALVITSLVRDNLASGSLVRPFDQVIGTDLGYFFVTPKAASNNPVVRTFREWLMNKVALDVSAQGKA